MNKLAAKPVVIKDQRRAVKILYIIGTLDVGGTERQLVDLTLRLDRKRFRPVVCCLSSGGPLEPMLRAGGIKARCYDLRGLKVWRNPIQVGRRLLAFLADLRAEQPEIVHGFLFHAYVLGAFAAKMAGGSIVIASRRSLGHFKRRRHSYRVAEWVANWMTDLIVANSEAVKRDVVRQEKVEPSNVSVIYNGVDPSLYDVQADRALWTSLWIPEGAKVVSVVANLLHYKGHRFFLQACREIQRAHSAVKFLLIGDGPLRGTLEGFARDLDLEKDVLFLGSRQDIPQLLALTDIAVLPSLEEGFSNAILEAMAAGKPVVATTAGGNAEAVIHGETGLLVPPRDSEALAQAVLWLLAHPAEAARFGEAGRRRVTEQFGLSGMIRQYEAVYERLVAEECANRVQKRQAGALVP